MSTLRRAFLAIALALVLLPLAASAPLFDPDEGLHAAIAQEMVSRGDYVTPTFMGAPFLDKPILFFWTEAASLRVFGNHEAAVRLPPLLFGLLGMLSVAWLGRELFGEAAGLLSGIVYGTMLLPLGVSEVAVHDVGLVPFLCVAAWCLLRTATSRSNAVTMALVAGVALGLSILTKGLVGVVFAGIFAMCLAVQRPSALARLALVLAGAGVVAALVAAPWYIAMERAHAGYLHYYFIERHVQGYLTSTQRHAGRPFWYYVPIVIGGALPWTAYLAGAGRHPRAHPMLRAMWAWFAIGFVFLSIGESKLVTYVLPLFPALALLAGEYVERVTRSAAAATRAVPKSEFFHVAFVLQAITLALLPIGGLAAVDWKFGGHHTWLAGVAIVLALAVAETARRAWRARSADGLFGFVTVMLVASVAGLTLLASPAAAEWMTARDLARALNAAGTLPSQVLVLDERIGSLVFYLDPALRRDASSSRIEETSLADAIGRMRVAPDDAVFAVRENQLARFTRLFAVAPKPSLRAGTFMIYRADRLRASLGGR